MALSQHGIEMLRARIEKGARCGLCLFDDALQAIEHIDALTQENAELRDRIAGYEKAEQDRGELWNRENPYNTDTIHTAIRRTWCPDEALIVHCMSKDEQMERLREAGIKPWAAQ